MEVPIPTLPVVPAPLAAPMYRVGISELNPTINELVILFTILEGLLIPLPNAKALFAAVSTNSPIANERLPPAVEFMPNTPEAIPVAVLFQPNPNEAVAAEEISILSPAPKAFAAATIEMVPKADELFPGGVHLVGCLSLLNLYD